MNDFNFTIKLTINSGYFWPSCIILKTGVIMAEKKILLILTLKQKFHAQKNCLSPPQKSNGPSLICYYYYYYSVYKKKLYPSKFKLSASYCINLTALPASNYDPQKQKALYTLEINNNVISFPRVLDLVFLRIINSKHSELSN